MRVLSDFDGILYPVMLNCNVCVNGFPLDGRFAGASEAFVVPDLFWPVGVLRLNFNCGFGFLTNP